MPRLLFIKRIIAAITGGYGLLYNWWCTQPQLATVILGYLYNYYTASDTRNIANVGWHVPSRTEVTTITTYLNTTIAGGRLKEIGFDYWDSPNDGAVNDVGFNARGTGIRSDLGAFGTPRVVGDLWTSTESTSTSSYIFYLRYNDASSVSGYGRSRKIGLSIRLIKDTTTLTHGQTGSYTGNDGKTYATICIGTQEWVSANLMETKYRDGSAIPEVTDNTAWAGLTTGARCSYNNLESNAGTTKSIAPVGWHVPSQADVQVVIDLLGDFSNVGGKLKEIGIVHWNDPNIEATNEVAFNAVAAGERYSDGLFTNDLIESFKKYVNLWTTTVDSPDATYFVVSIYSHSAEINNGGNQANLQCGESLRLIKDDPTGWVAGDTLTDADGNVYQTVKIGTQVWIASNWKCTKWNDGTPIAYVSDNAAWAALTSPAWCDVNGDPANK